MHLLLLLLLLQLLLHPSPVSLAGDIGNRFAPLALRRRTIRFAGGLGDGGICKRERHAAR